MAFTQVVLAAMLVGFCFSTSASGLSEADLPTDDVCAPDDEECSLSLRQLRGEVAAAEVRAHEEGQDVEEQAEQEAEEGEEVDGDQLFHDTDADGDGEVQYEEVLDLLSRLGVQEADKAKQLFEAEDSDVSAGLDTEEFAAAQAKWATTCSAAHRSSFCSGSTQVRCCKRGAFWKQCGSVRSSRSCFHRTTFTSCSAARRSWFCSGTTRINCCRRSGRWRSCGSVRTFSSCR